MGQVQAQYEQDGFSIVAEQVAPDEVLQAALQGMVAVRDGVFDMGMAPTEHPGYDPAVLCKINNPHRSDKGLHGLVTCPEVGRQVAEVTGSEKSPPGGETAPTMVTEPSRLGPPRHWTRPARS